MIPDYELIDVCHTVEDGMITYKGLPAPVITDHLTREASTQIYTSGTEFQIGKIEMVANTGTYLDAPFHRYREGKDLSQLLLEQLADLEAVVVRIPAGQGRGISPEQFQGLDLANKAVLVHTDWAVHWRTERYLSGHPFLTGAAAALLVDA